MPSHMSADMSVRSVCMDKEAFNPALDVSSATCIFWFDPTKPDSCYPTFADLNTDTNRINTNGASVGAIRDNSGFAHHLVQSTAANRPLYNTVEFGGRRSLSFDGVNDFLEFVGPPLGDHPTTSILKFAVFCVAKSTSTGAWSTHWAWARTTVPHPNVYGLKSTANTLHIDIRDDSTFGSFISDGTLSLDPHVLVWRASATRRLVRIEDLNTETSSFTAHGAVTTDVFAMGIRKSTALSHPFLGFISEMLIYDVDVSNADAASIATYLRTKWGI